MNILLLGLSALISTPLRLTAWAFGAVSRFLDFLGDAVEAVLADDREGA